MLATLGIRTEVTKPTLENQPTLRPRRCQTTHQIIATCLGCHRGNKYLQIQTRLSDGAVLPIKIEPAVVQYRADNGENTGMKSCGEKTGLGYRVHPQSGMRSSQSERFVRNSRHNKTVSVSAPSQPIAARTVAGSSLYKTQP